MVFPAGLPSGLFPATNLLGQNIGSIQFATPQQAMFTAIQAMASTPLTAINAATGSVTTLLTGSVNAANTLLLGILGAPFGTTSGIFTAGQGFLPFFFPFFGPSGLQFGAL